MKLKFILTLILLNTYILFSQTTDTIYYNKEWKKCPKDLAFYFGIRTTDNKFSGSETAYYITGEKHSIKGLKNGSDHGKAIWWYKTGQKWCEGNYNLGIEEGQFTYWYPDGKVQEEGKYVKGERDENWNYYDENGFLFYEYNEVNVKPLFFGAADEESSVKKLYKYLEHVSYPNEAKQMSLEGKVLIEFTVDQFGKVINVNVAEGINHFLDESAKKTIEQLPNWKPGSHKGKNVRVKILVPIIYKLDQKKIQSPTP